MDTERVIRKTTDIGHLSNVVYNEDTGAIKVIKVSPAVIDTYTANTPLGFGRYIVPTGATYGLDIVGFEHDPTKKYKKGDIAVNGTDLYICVKETLTDEVFDVKKWVRIAPKTVAGIPCIAGEAICTGKYHNTFTVGGFIVADDSFIHIQNKFNNFNHSGHR